MRERYLFDTHMSIPLLPPILGIKKYIKLIKVYYYPDDPNDTQGYWTCPRCHRQSPEPGRYDYCRACAMGLDYPHKYPKK